MFVGKTSTTFAAQVLFQQRIFDKRAVTYCSVPRASSVCGNGSQPGRNFHFIAKLPIHCKCCTLFLKVDIGAFN